MTSKELLTYALNHSGNQLSGCLDGMTEQAFDTHCAPNGMTPREIVEHLCEAYVAFAAHYEGKEHEWGSFSIADKSTGNIQATFRTLREKAVSIAQSSDDEAVQKAAIDYISAHDCYHVSQLVLARLQAEPDWNHYAIYG